MDENIDIFNIPLYYISFKKNDEIENHYKKFSFKNINHFEAIDGRKYDKKELILNNTITIRSYDDLSSGRHEHSGISSKGAIGCALSHYELWKKCIENNYDYIIITEEDNKMIKNLDETDLNSISKILKKPKSLFFSLTPEKQEHRKHFFGTHFYIASKDACKELIKNFFPIDVQVDWYIANRSTLNLVFLDGFKISRQSLHVSSIQDLCIKCFIPKHQIFYILFILFILIILYYSLKKCKPCNN